MRGDNWERRGLFWGEDYFGMVIRLSRAKDHGIIRENMGQFNEGASYEMVIGNVRERREFKCAKKSIFDIT